jgi:hypothetical protein
MTTLAFSDPIPLYMERGFEFDRRCTASLLTQMCTESDVRLRSYYLAFPNATGGANQLTHGPYRPVIPNFDFFDVDPGTIN